MRYVVVVTDELAAELLAPSVTDGRRYIVDRPALRARLAREGADVVVGDVERPAVYRRVLRSSSEPVLVAVHPARQRVVVDAIRGAARSAPVLALTDDPRGLKNVPGVATISPAAFGERVVAPALERTLTRMRVGHLRDHLAARARVLIMMQDDPDPDAIASALALRTLLSRPAAGAPIATFGAVTRAENRAMIRALRIEVSRVTPREVAGYDGVAMVDAQPPFFEENAFARVDLVIDHHPEGRPVRADIKDIRPSYGATSTILTEYLRAADTTVTPRLATALLYGIKTDTQDLERGATHADLEAFAFLHARASLGALRRIERPELTSAALDALARGLEHRRVVDGVVFSHLGRVGYPELVAQFADLFLQVRGARWSVVSGIVSDELHISVRATGAGRAAGAVVRRAFGDLGSAGGHREMAKAVVRLADWRSRVGPVSGDALGRGIAGRFRRALADA